MTARSLCSLLVLLAGLISAGALHADTPVLGLGPLPTNGEHAKQSMPDRSQRVVRALACGDELSFLVGIDIGQSSGRWPLSHLIAKAAHLSGSTEGCQASESLSLDWGGQVTVDGEERFKGGNGYWIDWMNAGGVGQPLNPVQARVFANLIQAVYDQRFGEACKNTAIAEGSGVVLRVSPACLMRQISVVINHERLGRWEYEEKDGSLELVPLDPGTSKLPCLTELRSSAKGDWDMSVTDYTRLAFYFERARSLHPQLWSLSDAAMMKLDSQLLTLRDGPAREQYSVLWSCGNSDSKTGTASEHVGASDYDAVAATSTGGGGRSALETFLRWLAFLAIVIAVVITAGAAAGMLAGAAAGLASGAAVAVVVGAGVVAVVLASGEVRIQETENHLFMQNSAKYLKNKRMLAELEVLGLEDHAKGLRNHNEEVRQWLLRRMARVASEDFIEYNSKPYARLTHNAILNLADFSCAGQSPAFLDVATHHVDRCPAEDRAVETAAMAVLDLSAAKVAVGSMQSRRIVPYRRLVEENMRYRDEWRTKPEEDWNSPKRLLDFGGGSDHLLAALQFWTGQTVHGPHRLASRESLGQMLWHATSRYRPSALILDLAIDKSSPMEQTFRHAGWEHYSSGSRWLLTAGGDSTDKANGVEILGDAFFMPAGPGNDRGVGVPTTLIVHTADRCIDQPQSDQCPWPPSWTAGRQDTYRDFLRFEGRKEDWGKDEETLMQSFSSNRCVSGRFACGLRLEVPESVAACLGSPSTLGNGEVRFLSSADCAVYRDEDGQTSNDFYLAVFGSGCTGSTSRSCKWGFLEMVEATQFESLGAYRSQFLSANSGHSGAWGNSDGSDRLTMASVGSGGDVGFTPASENFGHECRACGSAITHAGGAAFEIRHPNRPNQSVIVDLNDALAPKREGVGVSLD